MDQNDTTSASRFRLRYSLLTVLLVMALVACGITIWQLWREVGPLREEVRDLRAQLGVLTIDENARIHVVEVKEAGSFQWNWRVWLPEGHDFWLCASRSVPPDGVAADPQFRTRLGMGGREFNIRVRVGPNENGNRTVYLQSPTNDSPILEVEDTKWVRGDAMLSMDVNGRESQVSSMVNDPAVLLRMREASSASQPSEGLLIWITNRR